MKCEDRKDLLFLYAADALEPVEREELRRHLATGCPACAGALAESYATLAQLSQALPPVEPAAQLKQQLMDRIASGARSIGPTERSATLLTAPSRGAAASTVTKSTSPRKLFATGLLSAAAAVAITSAVFWNAVRDDVRTMHSSDLHMVSLASDLQPTAKGRVIWDKDAGQWHVAVFDMKPPPKGRIYELWFITPDGTKIPSETFDVDPSGKASLTVQVPKSLGTIALAAITDEPFGGVSQPTGAIQLAGKIP